MKSTQVRAVVGVDHADAAVAEDVVAREEQVAHPERELAGGVARACSRPPASCRRSCRTSPSSITRSTLQRRHRDVDVLGVDPGVGQDLVPFLDGGDALGVRGHLALEHLAGPREPLGVIDVGVGRDDHLARGEAEIHLADQLEHVGQLVEEARRRSRRIPCRRRSGRCSPPSGAAPGSSSRSRQGRRNAARSFEIQLPLRTCPARRIFAILRVSRFRLNGLYH